MKREIINYFKLFLILCLISFSSTLKTYAEEVNSKKDHDSHYSKDLKIGERLFFGLIITGDNTINCASCHKEPLFSSTDFKNNGLNVDSTLNDFGRMMVTKKTQDSLKFKVPTLRNIQFTQPYTRTYGSAATTTTHTLTLVEAR